MQTYDLKLYEQREDVPFSIHVDLVEYDAQGKMHHYGSHLCEGFHEWEEDEKRYDVDLDHVWEGQQDIKEKLQVNRGLRKMIMPRLKEHLRTILSNLPNCRGIKMPKVFIHKLQKVN